MSSSYSIEESTRLAMAWNRLEFWPCHLITVYGLNGQFAKLHEFQFPPSNPHPGQNEYNPFSTNSRELGWSEEKMYIKMLWKLFNALKILFIIIISRWGKTPPPLIYSVFYGQLDLPESYIKTEHFNNTRQCLDVKKKLSKLAHFFLNSSKSNTYILQWIWKYRMRTGGSKGHPDSLISWVNHW